MEIHFHKYQGTGNDFILVDNREGHFQPTPGIIKTLCDRRFGIGADGLILIENHIELDYKMVYFNSDGSQSLCGNGSRCGFAFARSLGMVSDTASFETTDGVHQIKLENDLIHFQLFDVQKIEKLSENDWFIHTGSPHFIRLVPDIEAVDVVTTGREIRNASQFSGQNGTNVNFAQLLHDRVELRTYERGVENETLSCGTGATAVGILAVELGFQSPVRLQTRGGTLQVSLTREGNTYTNIWLAGPARKVFEGSVII
ncbi:MAG: diaminopimelate epimerase [Ekhidna sp.]